MKYNLSDLNIILTTPRIAISEFSADMVQSVHMASLDEDNRKFMPDEVFETVDDARQIIQRLISCYNLESGPFVYPILLLDGTYVGHVEAAKIDRGWEIGYHIASIYTRQGLASEAVAAFVIYIMKKLDIPIIYGICLADNIPSRRVLEKSGFTIEFEGDDPYQGNTRHIAVYTFSTDTENTDY